jgi:hypothetical protein
MIKINARNLTLPKHIHKRYLSFFYRKGTQTETLPELLLL